MRRRITMVVAILGGLVVIGAILILSTRLLAPAGQLSSSRADRQGEGLALDSRTADSAARLQPGAAASAPAPKPAAQAAPAQQSGQAAPVDVTQRLILRTANLTLLVEDVSDAAAKIRQLADSYKDGFVVNSVQREENGRPAATVTIRVPAERFDEAMEKLRGLAVRVQNEQVTSKDVTEEFVDTDARLRNLQATEQRYLDLLPQARTVEDILKIEQQLSSVRGQIEQLQGRLSFLQRSATTSLITVELRLPVFAQTPLPDFSLLPVVQGAWRALLSTLQLLLAGAVWVAVFTPIWLPLAYLMWRWRRGATRVRAASA